MLSDANLLNDPTDTELLIGASSSIRSSLAVENHHDLGTRLAVRLLLPHVEIDSALRITASLVDTLEHHSPKSDAEANSILSLCRKLIDRKTFVYWMAVILSAFLAIVATWETAFPAVPFIGFLLAWSWSLWYIAGGKSGLEIGNEL